MALDIDLEEILQDLRSYEINDKLPLDPSTKTTHVPLKPSQDEIDIDIKKNFLTPSNELTWDLLDEFQQIPEADQKDTLKFYSSLTELPASINRTAIRFRRRGIDGDIVSYQEVFDLSVLDTGNSATNSLSMQRKFTNKNEAIRGNTTFLPFQPGGLTGTGGATAAKPVDSTRYLHKDDRGLFDIPQGLSRGLELPSTINDDDELTDLQNGIDDELNKQDEVMETTTDNNNDNLFPSSKDDADLDDDIADIIPADMLVRPTSTSVSAAPGSSAKKAKKEWAHVVELTHYIENFDELVPNPARSWPFKLDIFQQEAVYHLEQGDSVFIAAHTSAGKTVVAEYAIAMAHRNMTKAIYTSPIKALSNQKFRDFKETFKEIDVGVITGDVQINPDANCLIMTTEILRSMLYRGADVIRDVEFVIFDEVHYVNDVDRGVVWEEVIIMLPDHIKVILLSATVPNTYEFASWVGRTKQKDIYVISTPKRPVPLEIFIWAKDDVFKAIDSNRNFLESNFRKHADKLTKPKEISASGSGNGNARGGRGGIRGGLQGRGGSRGGSQGGRGGRGGGSGGKFMQRDGPNKNTWVSLVQYLKKNDLLPGVVFVFSKKRCEEYADSLSGVNFCNARESSEIHMFIDKAVSRLKREDRELPQILKVREMLSRGIAVHHGGLLPIIKEVIEILFSKTLIKVLFATETFAMGLNLPTRTVVFSELRKHDGTGFRNLLPGEFTQMSGRAGRRGLDSTGTVIVMSYNQPLEQPAFKEVTLGTPTKLSSQFRLTYNMILNLLRIEALRVEEMIKRSFNENTTQSLLPEHQMEVLRLEKELKESHDLPISVDDMEKLNIYYNAMESFKNNYGLLTQECFKLIPYQKTLRVGKLVVYRDENNVSKPAVTAKWTNGDSLITLLTFEVSGGNKNQYDSIFTTDFDTSYAKKFFNRWNYKGNLNFISVPLTRIEFITDYSIKSHINGIIQRDGKAINFFNDEIQHILQFQYKLREINWKNFQNPRMQEILSEITENKLIIESFLSNEEFIGLFNKYYGDIIERKVLENKIGSLKTLISDDNLELLPDYEQRLSVLKELKFIDDTQLTVNLKGRVACEINSGWELILTELVFDNFLTNFTSEEIVALLSCFVYEGKRNNQSNSNGGDGDSGGLMFSTPRLEKGKERIVGIIERMLKTYADNGVILTSEEEQFLENNRFGLVNTVYEWARGQTFKEIMELSNENDEAEGTIVRVITRLDEICREVKNCALIIGDSSLHLKMNDAQEKIKRDIVFCASLYL